MPAKTPDELNDGIVGLIEVIRKFGSSRFPRERRIATDCDASGLLGDYR